MKWQNGFEHDIAAITTLLDGLINVRVFEFNISLWVRPESTNKRDEF